MSSICEQFQQLAFEEPKAVLRHRLFGHAVSEANLLMPTCSMPSYETMERPKKQIPSSKAYSSRNSFDNGPKSCSRLTPETLKALSEQQQRQMSSALQVVVGDQFEVTRVFLTHD